MSTTMMPIAVAVMDESTAKQFTIFVKETKYEILKSLRLPIYIGGAIGMPILLYILFGLTMGGKTHEMSTFLMTSYACFGVIGASLFGVGVGLAVERGQGWMQLKRASPMPLAAYFTAKLLMAMSFSVVIVVVLFALGRIIGGVHLPPLLLLKLGAVLTIGSVPFCALGVAIGYFAGPNSAAAVANLINLPMAFCSGLWIPIQYLPKLIQRIAPALPAYHFSQLATNIVGIGQTGHNASHIEALIGFTLICLGAAAIAFRRDEGKLYG